jgi:hypothetical protein
MLRDLAFERSLAGGYDGKLGSTVCRRDDAGAEVLGGVEVGNRSGLRKFKPEGGSGSLGVGRQRANAGYAGVERGLKGFDSGPNGGNAAEASNDHAAVGFELDH